MDAIQIKCTDALHASEDHLYCRVCNVLACDDCKTFHKDHLNEFGEIKSLKEDIIQKSKEFSDELKQKVEELQNVKGKDEEYFNESIQNHYDSQVTAITNHFRVLHDSLHFKEVEFKRELKSYHDENLELLATIISKLEFEIDRSNKFIAEFNTQIQSVNDDNNNNNNNYHKHLITSRLNFLNETQDQIEIINNNNNNNKEKKSTLPPRYKFISLDDVKSKETIDTMKLRKKLSICPYSFQLKNKIKISEPKLYYISPGFPFSVTDIFTGNTRERELLPNHGSYFWENSVTPSGEVYLFPQMEYYCYDINQEVMQVDTGRTGIELSCSTIYDGCDHIYLFLPYDSQENLVYKFNIVTKQTEAIRVNNYDNLSYLSFDVDKEEGLIYLIGGYNPEENWQNCIRSLDIATNEIKVIVPHLDKSISGGCYVPSTNCFYLSTWSSEFVKYDVANKKLTDLSFPDGAYPNYTKLIYCEDIECIYMFNQSSESIHTYDIDDDIWTPSPIKLPGEILGSCFISMKQ